MQVGFFTAPHIRAILVVMDYENWTSEILKRGFHPDPVVTRRAFTPELVAFETREDTPPIWTYRDYEELIDDEIKSGACHVHLQALTRLTMSVLDRIPMPTQATGG